MDSELLMKVGKASNAALRRLAPMTTNPKTRTSSTARSRGSSSRRSTRSRPSRLGSNARWPRSTPDALARGDDQAAGELAPPALNRIVEPPTVDPGFSAAPSLRLAAWAD